MLEPRYIAMHAVWGMLKGWHDHLAIALIDMAHVKVQLRQLSGVCGRTHRLAAA